jgi:hypothetical protein
MDRDAEQFRLELFSRDQLQSQLSQNAEVLLRLEANAPRLGKADIRALGPDLTVPQPGDTFDVL